MRAAALAIALAVVTGCQSLDALRPLEPRARDPLPLQVVKGVAYVPAAAVLVVGVATIAVASSMAEHRGNQIAVDEELGRATVDRQIY